MGQIPQKVSKTKIWIQRLFVRKASNQILTRSLQDDATGAKTNFQRSLYFKIWTGAALQENYRCYLIGNWKELIVWWR